MTTQALTLPLDITWQRFGYSRDMIDTNFGDLDFLPKWRSSMAVYSYVVPKEQTAESYPTARIVYLRLTCSITGWNPSEDLQNAVNIEEIGDQLDDAQKSIWEVIQADGWAKTYWPCLGAIAQIAIYPGPTDGEVGPDDFPFILDFEPKKRELYETRSETGEFLSGSSDKLNIQKGSTTTESTEESDIITGGGGEIGIGPVKVGGNVSGEWGTRNKQGTESTELKSTDTSRERRETTSFSTTFNQMYQLFNGYHLGTNRAVFAVAPRPHVVNDAKQAPFNMIRGQRQLEGLQDMFLVVYAPETLKGICIQANLDTGHRAMFSNGVAYAIRTDEIPGDIGSGSGKPSFPLPPIFPGDGELAPPNQYQLVVTRRTVRNCGIFNDESGTLTPTGDPTNFTEELPRIAFETPLAGPKLEIESQLLRSRASETETPFEIANQLNRFQHEVTSAMVSGFSAGRYKTRPFYQTDTFRRLTYLSLRNVVLDLNQLVKLGHLSRGDAQSIQRVGARTVSDLFGKEIESSKGVDLKRLVAVRNKVIQVVMAATRGKEKSHG